MSESILYPALQNLYTKRLRGRMIRNLLCFRDVFQPDITLPPSVCLGNLRSMLITFIPVPPLVPTNLIYLPIHPFTQERLLTLSCTLTNQNLFAPRWAVIYFEFTKIFFWAVNPPLLEKNPHLCYILHGFHLFNCVW